MAGSITVMFEMTGDIAGTFKNISSTASGCNKQFEQMLRHISKLEQRYAALNRQTKDAARQFQSLKDHMGNMQGRDCGGQQKPPPGGRRWNSQ